MASDDDWERELNRMMDLIEKQSTNTFEKVHQHFMALGFQFDDEFRQNVVKMVNLR